jgi:hypothetical protein
VQTVAIVGVAFLLIACDGFVGEASVRSSSATTVDTSSASVPAAAGVTTTPPPVDPRQIPVRFDGADEATIVNPGMDYRFHLALANNSDRMVTAVRGVVSLRSRSGSDLLVKYPFRTSDLSLRPGQTARIPVEVPLASDIASRATLTFDIISVDTN